MNQWNFYMSGILYGKFQLEKDTILESRLDITTGQFIPYRPLSEDDFYSALCSRSLKTILEKLDIYQTVTDSHMDEITVDNEIFTKCRDGSYIQRIIKFPKKLVAQNGVLYGVLMSGRDYGAVLVKKGYESMTFLTQWTELYSEHHFSDEFSPGPIYPVHFHGTFMVETRDKEQLATDVYLPQNPRITKYPTVLIRTPYGKSDGKESYYRYVQRGYAVVIQDVRGREDSTGKWLPSYYEVEDGDDTLNWIAAQPWSDGSVGMTGGSYLGFVQWAAAASGNPHLKAILSSVCAGSAFVDGPRRGGCFESGMMAWAFAMTQQRFRADLMERDDWDQVLDIRPLKDVAPKSLGHAVPFLEEWLEHPHMDDFWKKTSWKDRYQGEPVPALIMSGWFDDNGMGTTEALDLTKDWPEGMRKVILGPWKHSGNANYDIHNLYVGENALRFDLDIICLKWLDHFLKDINNGIEQTAPVEYYTIGQNQWKNAVNWPVESASVTTWYLNTIETVNEASDISTFHDYLNFSLDSDTGKGILSTEKPDTASISSYTYDPEHPAIHIIDMSENEISVPEDYTEEEKRPDVLTFSTPVLTNDLTVTGDIYGEIYFTCDCPDTDIVIRLTDVDEQGRSTKLADGILDVKYRNSFETPEYLEPDQVYKAVIRTSKISNTFKAGHQMRITVTSSAKNFVFPNSNTKDSFDSTYTQPAHINICHGGQYPSCVHIPVERTKR